MHCCNQEGRYLFPPEICGSRNHLATSKFLVGVTIIPCYVVFFTPAFSYWSGRPTHLRNPGCGQPRGLYWRFAFTNRAVSEPLYSLLFVWTFDGTASGVGPPFGCVLCVTDLSSPKVYRLWASSDPCCVLVFTLDPNGPVPYPGDALRLVSYRFDSLILVV